MKTASLSLAIAAALAGASACLPASALAAGGHGFGGGAHVSAGGHAYNGGGGWAGRPGGGYRGGYYRGGWGRGYYGGRGWGPGYFWGGLGLGLGVAAIGYYGGYYGNYYGPYPAAGAYYYDAPEVIVGPTYSTVEPAAGVRSGQPVPSSARLPDPIFYPRNGQGSAATENDRRECNRWATAQPGAAADASIFQRATLACMEGRGYTAR